MINALLWNSELQCFDYLQAPDNDLTRLKSAIAISLFTDARVPDSELPAGMENQGWWGDYDMTDSIGSRLWLLKRSKITSAVINSARDYINQALKWLVTDGKLLAIDLTVERQGIDWLVYQINCQLPDGSWEKIVLEQEYGV